MWAHQPFFSNMDYNLKVNWQFFLGNALMFSAATIDSGSTELHSAATCSVRGQQKQCFLVSLPFFVSPSKKHILKLKKPSGVELQLKVRNFLPLPWCTSGAAAIQSNLSTPVNYLLLPTFGFVLFGFSHFLISLFPLARKGLAGSTWTATMY